MSDRLQELAVFVRVAESGSFSRAGRELKLSQPSVSRIIGELEARLGVKLLLRTTRRITATDAGALFLERARDILAELEDAEDVAEGADVAIRLGELGDSAFGARRLATLPTLLVASPAYLRTRGTPKTPADLVDHDCIFGPGNFGRESWSFNRNGTEISVDVRGRISTNSGPGLLASVLAGLGITRASTVMAGDGIKTGLLVPLLRGYRLPPVDVHAVFPGGPRPSSKVRALVDYLVQELRDR
jgi:DNA-binding transcriptional LysR family regulator